MTVDISKVIAWFESYKGKLTYSMYGSRNGTDGTADCSGAITQALYEAGATNKYIPSPTLYSTVNLNVYLQANDFNRIAVNQEWEAKRGDIILMSWGSDMSTSGGAGGHVGILKDAKEDGSDGTFISVDYWTNGQTGTAVSEHSINNYLSVNAPSYFEVWRLSGRTSANKPSLIKGGKAMLFKLTTTFGDLKSGETYFFSGNVAEHVGSATQYDALVTMFGNPKEIDAGSLYQLGTFEKFDIYKSGNKIV